MTEYIFSINIDVVSRLTGKKVKASKAYMRTQDLGTCIEVLAACEEGMFQGRFKPDEILESKLKADLSDDEFLQIFRNTLLHKRGESTVCVHGQLESLDHYNLQTGELQDEELSDEQPKLELLIQTNGILSVAYGRMNLAFVDEEGMSKQKSKFDLFEWLGVLAMNNETTSDQLVDLERDLEESEQLVQLKEREVSELTLDYKAIIEDMKERFVEMLEAKQRYITELKGNEFEDRDWFNKGLLEKRPLDLNILKVHDIVVEGNYEVPTRTSRKQWNQGRQHTRKKRKVHESDTNENEKHLVTAAKLEDDVEVLGWNAKVIQSSTDNKPEEVASKSSSSEHESEGFKDDFVAGDIEERRGSDGSAVSKSPAASNAALLDSPSTDYSHDSTEEDTAPQSEDKAKLLLKESGNKLVPHQSPSKQNLLDGDDTEYSESDC